jgi:hypothetical protein
LDEKMSKISSSNIKNQCWRYDAWIIQQPPLNLHNVLDYFKESHFYDATCNNAKIQMQQRDQMKLNQSLELNQLVGIEYEVVTLHQGSAFLINKQYRHSPKQTEMLASYFVAATDLGVDHSIGRFAPIARGTVFPLPEFKTVLSFNINSGLFHLKEAIYTINKSISCDSKLATMNKLECDHKTNEISQSMSVVASIPRDSQMINHTTFKEEMAAVGAFNQNSILRFEIGKPSILCLDVNTIKDKSNPSKGQSHSILHTYKKFTPSQIHHQATMVTMDERSTHPVDKTYEADVNSAMLAIMN